MNQKKRKAEENEVRGDAKKINKERESGSEIVDDLSSECGTSECGNSKVQQQTDNGGSLLEPGTSDGKVDDDSNLERVPDEIEQKHLAIRQLTMILDKFSLLPRKSTYRSK